MKILAVGYACNPHGGSEPGVGWTAVCRIATTHDVCVLTDIHNKPGWERAAMEGIIPENIKVRFLRDRSACSSNRFLAHLQSWLNYASFNRQVLAAARQWHQEENFDLCHQVTIAAWRMPSPLWQLPIPFVWGPIGGAGYIPSAFRSMLSPSARIFEIARDINSAFSRRSSAFQKCIQRATVIIAANEETEIFLKPYRKSLPLLRLPVTPVGQDTVKKLRRIKNEQNLDSPLHLFAGGNMIGTKGLSLAFRALAQVKQKGIEFHYTIGGGGPEIPMMRALATQLGLDSMIEFHPGFSGDDYINVLHATDVYFLPSFRETMGMTLVEAIFAGCYPVVADTSAQGEIVTLASGIAVSVESMDGLIQGLADAIIWCANHRSELPGLAAQAAERVADYFSSERYDETIKDAYELAVKQKSKS